MIRKLLLSFTVFALLLTGAQVANGQGMAVNATGAAPNSSAILDVSSTTQGMLIPRMNNSQMTGISSPATGLLVYCTNCSPVGFYYYTGSGWVSLNALSNVTTQGNTFNGTSELVQTNGSGQLPSISGVNLTSLTPSSLTGSGNIPAAAMPALTGGDVTSSAGSVSTTIANNAISGNHIVNALGSATTGAIPAARLGSSSGSATTFLNGSGAFAVPFTLTTTGSSGAATFSGGTLNIPQYSGGGSGANLGAVTHFTSSTTSYTVSASDGAILVDDVTFVFTLPAASSVTSGHMVWLGVNTTGSGSMNVFGNGSDVIYEYNSGVVFTSGGFKAANSGTGFSGAFFISGGSSNFWIMYD